MGDLVQYCDTDTDTDADILARKYYFLNVAILILQTLSFDKFYLTSKKVVKY